MKPDPPLLTIAIPTHGRATYLHELLSSLFAQALVQPKLEILISDNASPDHTPQVVNEFSERGLTLRYIRNEIDIGPDANFLQCYNLAAGAYVWIFGDDDLFLDGCLEEVIGILSKTRPDYAFVAPYVFRKTIDEIRPRKRNVPTQLVDDARRMATLVNIHADLILISSAIVNKERIAAIAHPPFESLVGTNLVQLGWVFTSLRHLRTGAFIQLGLLATRGANSRGGFQAAKVFGENYMRAIDTMLEPGSKLANRLVSDQLSIWFPRNWLEFREIGEEGRKQKDLVYRVFRSSKWYWLCVLPLMRGPRFIARLWAKLFWVAIRLYRESLSVSK